MDDASRNRLDKLKAIFADAKNHHAEGRFAEAERCYRQVVAAAPGWADGLNNLGSALWAQAKTDEAIDCYRRAIAADPAHALAHYNLGHAMFAGGDVPMAEQSLVRAIHLNPDFAEAHVCLGNLHLGRGDLDLAEQHYQRALQISPGNAQAHNNLGNVLLAKMRLDEAEVASRRAIQIQPRSAEFHNNLGLILDHRGKTGEAISAFRKAVELRPDFAEAHFNLSQAKRFTPADPDLAALRTLPRNTACAHFALGKALDDVGDHQQAFEQFAAGNRQKRRSISYDESAIRREHHRIRSVFNAELFERHRGSGNPSDIPVFVLGMPRSGSTLVEQILASHSRVHGAGELTVLSDITRRLPSPCADGVALMSEVELAELATSYLQGLPPLPAGKLRITDKMPGNCVHAGLIHLMLPNARIIHTIRDPVDTCLSCFSKLFAAGAQYSYDLRELGRYYCLYAQLMDHWRVVLPAGVMLDVSYEALVNDLEGQSRRMIEHCGLPWDERCLKFHENNRAIATPSRMNVREPIYRGSIGRWKHDAAQLRPLLEELAKLKK
jgi:tetratricopeptide (TPR) repeat protein